MYKGKVVNGVIVIEGSARLPEGAEVRVDLVNGSVNGAGASQGREPTWADVFEGLVGKAEGLPSDMAGNHDHYLHGAPRP